MVLHSRSPPGGAGAPFEFIGKKLRGSGNAPPKNADPLKKASTKINDFIKSPKKKWFRGEEGLGFLMVLGE